LRWDYGLVRPSYVVRDDPTRDGACTRGEAHPTKKNFIAATLPSSTS